jgi:acyl-CoA thioesterase-1
LLRAIAFHCAGGDSLYSGAALLLACIAWRSLAPGRGTSVRAILALVSVLLILLSTAPLPIVMYVVWAASLIWWVKRPSRPVVGVLAACTAAAIGWEGWIALRPLPRVSREQAIAVVGDSLSTLQGYPDSDLSWPEYLRGEFAITNLAQPGATAADGLHQASEIPERTDVVIVFLGGNDLLGGTPSARYAEDFDRLLSQISRPGRQVYLVELPLIPLSYPYGWSLRQAAAKHGAVLVPRRVVANVLASETATSDGLHLTRQGARAMADSIWRRIGPAR